MKLKKIATVWTIALLVGGLMGASGLAANAAQAYGSWSNFNGYRGRSVIDNTIKKAGSSTGPQSGSVAAGWLGVRGLLYKQSTGALCRSAGWVYNSTGGATLLTGGWTSGYCGAGAYQSYSVSRGWNSSGSFYNEYWLNISPALNF